MAEVNEDSKFRLGIKDAFNITVIIVGITISFITNKLTTQYEIDNIKGRLNKIEEVKPEMLQWQLNSMNEKFEDLKKTMEKQNEMISNIYDSIIKN